MSLKLDKLKILVVDDIEPIKQLIADTIGTLGVQHIHTASDGNEAFDVFCNTNPDIVLTDWHMPRGSGIDLMKKIRTSDYSPNKMVPIIMITGYSAPSRIATCRDGGATEFLAKPFDAKGLIMRISHVIKHPRDFIDCLDYFGPDRRRNLKKNYQGAYKRQTDFEPQ
tara:strand:+ start:3720 stop:4220 length:501 start_codon:yes stop_codon:yes gene_type:complete